MKVRESMTVLQGPPEWGERATAKPSFANEVFHAVVEAMAAVSFKPLAELIEALRSNLRSTDEALEALVLATLSEQRTEFCIAEGEPQSDAHWDSTTLAGGNERLNELLLARDDNPSGRVWVRTEASIFRGHLANFDPRGLRREFVRLSSTEPRPVKHLLAQVAWTAPDDATRRRIFLMVLQSMVKGVAPRGAGSPQIATAQVSFFQISYPPHVPEWRRLSSAVIDVLHREWQYAENRQAADDELWYRRPGDRDLAVVTALPSWATGEAG